MSAVMTRKLSTETDIDRELESISRKMLQGEADDIDSALYNDLLTKRSGMFLNLPQVPMRRSAPVRFLRPLKNLIAGEAD